MPYEVTATTPRFCGETVTGEQLELIKSITKRYQNLSRTELAATACELLGWLRNNGKPKIVEGLVYLEKLEQLQQIKLPAVRKRRSKSTAVAIASSDSVDHAPVQAGLGQLAPVSLQRVVTPEQRNRWRSLVEQYHIRPWLLETMVDASRFAGTCYRAANWIDVGETSGRGRDDRTHQRDGAAPKQVWLYPLHRQSRARLCRGA